MLFSLDKNILEWAMQMLSLKDIISLKDIYFSGVQFLKSVDIVKTFKFLKYAFLFCYHR